MQEEEEEQQDDATPEDEIPDGLEMFGMGVVLAGRFFFLLFTASSLNHYDNLHPFIRERVLIMNTFL